MTVLIGIGLSVLGLVANVISIAIPYWQYYTYKYAGKRFVSYQGLWESCGGAFGASFCVNMDRSLADRVQAVRALMIIGAVCIAIGIGIALYGVRSKQTVKSAGFVVAFGGVCCVVAAIIYRAKAPHGDVEHLHAGFGIAIATGVVSFVGGCFLLEQMLETGDITRYRQKLQYVFKYLVKKCYFMSVIQN